MLSTQPKAKAIAHDKDQAFLALGNPGKLAELRLVKLVAYYYKTKRLVFSSASSEDTDTNQEVTAAATSCFICGQTEQEMYRLVRRRNAPGQKINDTNWQHLFSLVFCEACQERLVQFFAS